MISLFDVLKQKNYLELLEKSIKNSNEATETFKNQHLDNIENFLKTTEIPDDWYIVLHTTNIDPILHRITVDFDVHNNFLNLMMFSVESYVYEESPHIYIKDLIIYFKNLTFKTKDYLSKTEFVDVIKVYEIISKQQEKEELG